MRALEPAVGHGRLATPHVVLQCQPRGDARCGEVVAVLSGPDGRPLLGLNRALNVALPVARRGQAFARLRRIRYGERGAKRIGTQLASRLGATPPGPRSIAAAGSRVPHENCSSAMILTFWVDGSKF